MVAERVIVRGRVQGVGYRAWTVSEARQRGLGGWVRNLTDGSVELVVSGQAEGVEAMIGLCREGPTSARVDALERYSVADAGLEGDFHQRPTGAPGSAV